MQISYEITEKDYVAFNLNYIKNHEAMQKRIRKTQLFGGIFILIAFIAYIAIYKASLIFIAVAIVAAALYAMYIPHSIKSACKKNVKNVLKSIAKTACGTKHFSLEETQIHLKSEGEDSKYGYDKILKIVTDTNHFYLYTGEMESVIIPFSAFSTENAKTEFYNLLTANIENAKGK